MATMSIDELNSFEPEKYIEDYFKPMPISEDRKEERRDAAKDFRDILLLILALIAIEYEKNLLDWPYIQAQFRKELLRVSLQYAAESEAIQDYVNSKSYEFIDITKEQDLSDPYWTSDMRATTEAVNESNDVIAISEMQRAEMLGAVEKRWKTEKDAKVRPTHRKVEGVTKPIDEMFSVGSDLMRFPHDWYYSAKESYNCRCGLDYLDENGKVVLVGKMKEEVNKNYNKVQYTKEMNNAMIEKRGFIDLDLQFFSEGALEHQSSSALRKGIRNLRARIEEHEQNIENPKRKWKEWDTFSDARKAREIHHWEHEIHNFKESIENRIAELRKRGEII